MNLSTRRINLGSRAIFAFVLAVGFLTAIAPSAEATGWIKSNGFYSRDTSVASSGDGTKLVAVGDNGMIETSTDSGATWKQSHGSVPTGTTLTSVASSLDGAKLVAVAGNGLIETSTDSGATWKSSSTAWVSWVSVASSSDGAKLVAVGYYGEIAISADSGATWKQSQAYYAYWVSVASSSDGAKLVAVGAYGTISTSADSGATWKRSYLNPPNGAYRVSIASSFDGVNLVMVGRNVIQTSADSGATWKQSNLLVPYGTYFVSVASSFDGAKLVAVDSSGVTVISADSGATWKQSRVPSSSGASLTSVASSSDGAKLVVSTNGNEIWAFATTPSTPPNPLADDSLLLGRAASFGVIAAAAITNGGGSSLVGDIGVFPGTAITGAETIALTGKNHGSDLTSSGAQDDLVKANDSITAKGAGTDIAAELGGQTVYPGTYTSVAAFGLTGVLTLDCQNKSNSVFVFKTPAALTSAAASTVVLQNCGSTAPHIYWQLGAAATLGASSVFMGTILAQAAITTGAGVTVTGRLLSLGAAVTLDSTSITIH